MILLLKLSPILALLSTVLRSSGGSCLNHARSNLKSCGAGGYAGSSCPARVVRNLYLSNSGSELNPGGRDVAPFCGVVWSAIVV